jgi:hypothetical protein
MKQRKTIRTPMVVFRLVGEGEPLEKRPWDAAQKRGTNAMRLYLEKTSIRGVERGK